MDASELGDYGASDSICGVINHTGDLNNLRNHMWAYITSNFNLA